jgi:hypothetical protein
MARARVLAELPEPVRGCRITAEDAGHGEIEWPAYAFTRKVKLQNKAAVKGGCG